MKKIAMGNDHSAVEMKEAIKAYVEQKGYEVIDFGTNSSESCDYPAYGEKVGRAVASGEADPERGVPARNCHLRYRHRHRPGSRQGKGRFSLHLQRAIQRKNVP